MMVVLVVVEPCYMLIIKQGFLIILMKVFSIYFAITGGESNMLHQFILSRFHLRVISLATAWARGRGNFNY